MPRPRRNGDDPTGFGTAAVVFTLLASMFAFGALFVAAQAWSRSNDAKEIAAAGGAGGTKVTLTEFAIDPAVVEVPEGGSLAVTNAGTVEHDVRVKGTELKTEMLQAGESGSLDLADLDPGMYTLYCEVSGHADQGMTAMLHLGIGGHGSPADAAAGATNTAANDDADELMAQRTQAFPAETEGLGAQPLEPLILPDGTKQFDVTAAVTDWEVEPGTTVQAWTYNGVVPGPMIKVQPGDRVRLALHNELPESTSIHLHGITVPNAMDGVPDITQPPVKPGESFNYEFVAQGPAVGIYHSHHHAEHQVPDGLFGPFIIGDEPVPPGVTVSQEIPMVLNDAGVIGLTLNGKSFPATAPIVAKQGEWVEIHYLNEGLVPHPMHLHGMGQLVIAKDGFPVPQPYEADTVLVAPGERYTVLVHATELGTWAFHCHILSHAESPRGMFGMVTAFVVQ
jgi:FtsP/CotA-like multicopper oxidase with cupredoxin domain